MCVIVDGNVAHEVFHKTVTEDGTPVREWLETGSGRLVFGGKLAKELEHADAARRYLIELTRQGRAIRVPPDKVKRAVEDLTRVQSLKSNDPHVIALARITGARVLFSRDQDLHNDFKNAAIIARPRGRVYTSRKHRRLLHHDSSCGHRREG